jgi:hypothetical protein
LTDVRVGNRDGTADGEAGGLRRLVVEGAGGAGFAAGVVLEVAPVDDVEFEFEFTAVFEAAVARVLSRRGILFGDAWFLAVAPMADEEAVFVTPLTTVPVFLD